jgi:VWFA-related protein
VSVVYALRMRLVLTAVFVVIACAVNLVFGQVVSASQDSPAPSSASSSTSPSAAAPQKSDAGGLVIKENVRRVILDVVVSDANGRPVRGLTGDDFSVAEDGKPQRMLSFDVHDFDAEPETSPLLPTRLPTNTFVNIPETPERGPLYVILYDMVNMGMDDQGAARKQLLKFISGKPPGVRFAIFVLSDGLRLVQGFTDDPYALFAAMDPKSPRAHVPKVFLYGDNFGVGEVNVIVSAFTQIAHYLNGLPGRKNLIWVTGSVATSILPTAAPNTGAVSYGDELKEAINAMARSQVAVYPVDVRGVVIPHPPGAGGTDRRALMTSIDTAHVNASYATEDELAITTGGHAFYSSNSLTEALAEATEAGGNYYTLSYAPSNENYDGQIRNIRVELAKRGYQLAYRHSYFGSPMGRNGDAASRRKKGGASDAGRLEDAKPVNSLFVNLRHGAPMAHQIVFKAHVYPLGAPAKATPEQMASLAQTSSGGGRNRPAKAKSLPAVPVQAYVVEYALPAQQLKAESAVSDRRQLLLELAAEAFDADGQMLVGKVEHARENISESPWNVSEGSSAASGELAFYRARQQIAVPLNATSIRIAVKDVSTDRVGTMEVTLPLAPEARTQAPSPVAAPARPN